MCSLGEAAEQERWDLLHVSWRLRIQGHLSDGQERTGRQHHGAA